MRKDLELEVIGAALAHPQFAVTDEWQRYEWECETCFWLASQISSRVAQRPELTTEELLVAFPDNAVFDEEGGKHRYLNELIAVAAPQESAQIYLKELHKMWQSERIDSAVNSAREAAGLSDPEAYLLHLSQIVQSEGASCVGLSSEWPILAFSEPYTGSDGAPYLIKGLLTRGDLAVLYGPSGSGKSFLAFDQAMAIARGSDWRGHRVNKAGVVYIVAEGAVGFDRRLAAYSTKHGISECNNFQRIIAAPNLVGSDSELTKLKQHIRQAASKLDDDLGLIVIDTLARVIPGQNENSFETMSAVERVAQELQRDLGALVELVHHTGKDAERGMRGHSSLFGACDTVLEVLKPNDVGETAAVVRKQKDGEQGAEYGFRLEQIDLGLDEDGDELSSCVVVPCNAPAHSSERPHTGHEERALTALKQACAASGVVSEDGIVPAATDDEWRDAFKGLPGIKDLKPDTANAAYRRAKAKLLGCGDVVEDQTGFTLSDYLPRSRAA